MDGDFDLPPAPSKRGGVAARNHLYVIASGAKQSGVICLNYDFSMIFRINMIKKSHKSIKSH